MRAWTVLLGFAFLYFLGCVPETPELAEPIDLIPGNSAAVLRINDTEQFRADYRNYPLVKVLLGEGSNTGLLDPVEDILALDPPAGVLIALGDVNNPGEWIMVLPNFSTPEAGLPPGSSPADSLLIDEPAWQLPDSASAVFREYQHLGLVGSSREIMDYTLEHTFNPPAGLDKALRASNPLALASFFLPPDPSVPGPEDDSEEATPDLQTWSAYDLLVTPGSLSFQTMETSRDSSALAELLMAGQPALPLQKAAAIVPGSAMAWCSYSLQQPSLFMEQQESITGKRNAHRELLEGVEQVSIVETGDTFLLILHSLSASAMQEELAPMQREPLEFQGTMVYPFDDEALLREALDPLLHAIPAPAYYCTLENAFVFSESLEALQEMISANNRKATFDQTRAYKNMESYLPAASSTLYVSEAPESSKLLRDSLTAGRLVPEILDNLPKGYMVATQLNLENNFTLSSYQFMDTGRMASDNPQVREVFTAALDAPVALRPQFLKNHRDGSLDIAVQDENHVLYLFSAAGSLYWKKELSGPVQGDIQQVDLLRNGRLQMAFTTDTELLVLDRNGKEVAPFPRDFPGGNLGPLAVFDYEQNRNYRLVVTQGSRVFMFDGQGRDVRGFKFRDAGSPVVQTPVHIRIGSRDYLLFQLEDGSLKILNRVGDTRIGVKESFEFSSNPVRLYRNGFAFTDRGGDLVRIDTRGRVSRTRLNLNPDHGMDATSRTLAVMDDNRFQVKGNQKELELGVYTKPRIFYINDIIYVAVTDLQSQQVYLFRSTAAPVDGFPVEGSGLADMADTDGDGNPELVAPYRDRQIRVYSLRR